MTAFGYLTPADQAQLTALAAEPGAPPLYRLVAAGLFLLIVAWIALRLAFPEWWQ